MRTTLNCSKFPLNFNFSYSTWLNDLETLSRSDGYDSWRRNEANKLRKIIAERIEFIQNPMDCDKAKIFKCYAYPEIGWGEYE